MKKIYAAVIVLIFLSFSQAFSQNAAAQTLLSKSFKLQIGETEIEAIVHTAKPENLLFFNMHDDENTSVEAAKKFVAANGGRIVELKHDGSRLIKFKLKNKKYAIDPNRIFTTAGIKKTLVSGGGTSPEAEKAVAEFAENLITKFLSGAKTIIALHNNTEDRYSIKSYEKGGENERDAADVHAKPENDADDFFFVTERRHFDALKAKNFNVALQNNETVTDDGSLSVYCGREKITYINSEAQHGHAAQQAKMLEALREILDN